MLSWFSNQRLTEKILDRNAEPLWSWGARSQGWECPKCGAVYAPSVYRCWSCGGNKESDTASTKENPDPNVVPVTKTTAGKPSTVTHYEGKGET